jgi:hypothetical protein
MAKKRKRGARAAASELNPRRVEQLLLATSFPRLQMVLILALAAVGAFMTSASLVAWGLDEMGLRYALAVVGGYFSFLGFVRLWIAYQTRNWSFGRRKAERSDWSGDIGNVDLPDLSALGELGSGVNAAFTGGGGDFGGGGASGSFGDALPSEESASAVLDGVGSGDGEGLAIVLALVALLGGLLALGFVVYSSPIMLAEVLLDVAVVGALYRKNQRHQRSHWAAGVLRRTYKPMLVLAFFAAAFGFAVQSLAPEQHTLGAVLEAYEASEK